MKNEKISKSISLIADATETGYSALYTFAVKELLSTQERQELVSTLRAVALEQSIELDSSPHLNHLKTLDFTLRK